MQCVLHTNLDYLTFNKEEIYYLYIRNVSLILFIVHKFYFSELLLSARSSFRLDEIGKDV